MRHRTRTGEGVPAMSSRSLGVLMSGRDIYIGWHHRMSSLSDEHTDSRDSFIILKRAER
jgi:hypothetical protein